jgi:hypothetical protein
MNNRGNRALGPLGRLNQKARGAADFVDAIVPLLPRFLRRPVRSLTRFLRRSDRKVRRVGKAVDKVRNG